MVSVKKIYEAAHSFETELLLYFTVSNKQSWWAEDSSLKINLAWCILCAVFEQMHIQYVRRERL